MKNEYIMFPNSVLQNQALQGHDMQKQAVLEVLKCNDITEKFGLVLSPQQATELVETRASSLKSNGRIEFGGGIIDKIIFAFCDSPYISKHNYTDTLHQLVDMFYYYKNETLDKISDDELIKFMRTCFDGTCQGSLEALQFRELEKIAKDLREGNKYE